jgi:hypothetical protein
VVGPAVKPLPLAPAAAPADAVTFIGGGGMKAGIG